MSIIKYIFNKLKKEKKTLVLGRRPGQKIIITIGDKKVEFLVHKIRGSIIYVGVRADKDITIYREEIYKQILIDKGLYEEE